MTVQRIQRYANNVFKLLTLSHCFRYALLNAARETIALLLGLVVIQTLCYRLPDPLEAHLVAKKQAEKTNRTRKSLVFISRVVDLKPQVRFSFLLKQMTGI